MERLLIFIILCIPVILLSWRTLFNVGSHGFYRFFSWICIIWLFASSYNVWFYDPFSLRQIFSWILLIISIYLVVAGVTMMMKVGKPGDERDDKTLYKFEKTSKLVDTGIFRYIRHPLYSSLIFLTWGIFLKNPRLSLLIFALLSTLFLFLTAIHDEKECKKTFGEEYSNYMKRSKRFIPFVF